MKLNSIGHWACQFLVLIVACYIISEKLGSQYVPYCIGGWAFAELLRAKLN